ncbi:MAG TPA: condensation domain-containing protein, partial [Longimicrobium sp.]|nr:condensation domain-containing protein [Longimicrobium sp.]
MTPVDTSTTGTDVFPVSFTQQRLWFLERMEGGSPAYGVTGALRLEGLLDSEALRRAMEEVVHRHESLRTTFATVDGEPVQVIHAPTRFELPPADFAPGDAAALRTHLNAAARRPFDLATGPLFRPLLLRLGAEEHVLVISMHHIVSDGWSLGVLFRELSALYAAFARGEPSPLPELPIQFADYAVWQRETLRGEALERHLSWWRESLAGAPTLLELATDRPRPPAQSHRGGRERVRLTPETVAALRALARDEGATLFMVMLTLWQILLAKYSGQDDVVVGTPIAGRTRAELEGLIGFFVNTLALRGNLAGDPTFRELLGRVRETTFDAYAHQEVPLERLVEELKIGRNLGHNPVFQAFITLRNASDDALRLDGLTVSPVEVESGSSKFDVSLLLRETGGGIEGWMEYASDLFDASTIARMREHLVVLAGGIAADPDRRISALSLLGDHERA